MFVPKTNLADFWQRFLSPEQDLRDVWGKACQPTLDQHPLRIARISLRHRQSVSYQDAGATGPIPVRDRLIH